MNDAHTILKDGNLSVIDTQTGQCLAESGPWVPQVIYPPYSEELGEAICHMVREGKTYREIVCDLELRQIQTIYIWKSKYAEFEKHLKQARRDRGDVFYDRVIEIADTECIEKDEVPGLKLKSDLYKWGAERANPEYGTKLTASTNTEATTIIIDTGIRRPEDIVEAEIVKKEVPCGTQLELPLAED
jgi:hypothetical protein